MPDDLFDAAAETRRQRSAPLADRMRPRTLDQFAGQGHILGTGKLLRRAVEADRVTSLILFGPPGTGKTTLARIIANTTARHFASLNAVLAGVKDIRTQIEAARTRLKHHGQGTILFVDEVHRFNKAQQDALLPHVENGTVTFIGATTENPYFEVNKALVSRSRIFELHPLTEADLEGIARQALEDPNHGYGRLGVRVKPDAMAHLVSTANGDARSLLGALELAVETTEPDAEGVVRIDLAVAEDSIQRRAVLYDKDGDAHYDTISAFIKSLRGSDPDAALYWMAKMIYAGEDPRFILRRMVIFAGEDIGMADPNAMRTAVACSDAFDRVGMPEGRFMLSQCCLYLATAPKSNSAFAFFAALEHVAKERTEDTPNHLKDGNRDKEGLGHGKGYKYPHAYQDHYVPEQYLPSGMQGTYFYDPSDQGYEARLRPLLESRRARDEAEGIEKRAQRYAENASGDE
ncbi:MAG: AAA family ATPase [Bacteroidota bacterium]